MIAAIRRWWRSATCRGSVLELAADSAAAAYLSPAGGPDVSTPQGGKVSVFHCSKWHDDCAGCPRFQAHRQGLAMQKDGLGDLHMGVPVNAIEADVRDGHREAAEVDRCHQYAAGPAVQLAYAHTDPHANAVLVESTPGVDDAKHCSQKRNCQRHCLNDRVVHRHILPESGMALPGLTAWLAGITLALLIGCAHYLDDIPDHSAEWDQAIYLQDAINAAIEQRKFDRAAQALCGPQAAWAQLQDGSVQCKTKHGRPTITVQVSP